MGAIVSLSYRCWIPYRACLYIRYLAAPSSPLPPTSVAFLSIARLDARRSPLFLHCHQYHLLLQLLTPLRQSLILPMLLTFQPIDFYLL